MTSGGGQYQGGGRASGASELWQTSVFDCSSYTVMVVDGEGHPTSSQRLVTAIKISKTDMILCDIKVSDPPESRKCVWCQHYISALDCSSCTCMEKHSEQNCQQISKTHNLTTITIKWLLLHFILTQPLYHLTSLSGYLL